MRFCTTLSGLTLFIAAAISSSGTANGQAQNGYYTPNGFIPLFGQEPGRSQDCQPCRSQRTPQGVSRPAGDDVFRNLETAPGWRCERNVGGNPVVRTDCELAAGQLILVKVERLGPRRNIGIGCVGGASFDRVWRNGQLCEGDVLRFCPNQTGRYGIGVGTSSCYDDVRIIALNGGCRLVFAGGTVLTVVVR